MAETASYTITITTDFAEWARYNLFMMCSCKNADGESVDFAHLISKGNADGNSIAPSSDARRKLQLTTAPCDSFELYIYCSKHPARLAHHRTMSPVRSDGNYHV